MKSLFSYKTAFKSSQMAMTAVCIACVFFSLVVYLKSEARVSDLRHKIYVMDKDAKITTAIENNIISGRKSEYKDHVRKFYTLWYALDENNFDENLKKAMYLMRKEQWELLKGKYIDQEVKKQLTVQNIQLFVEIKKIAINTETSPVCGTIEGIQIKKKLSGTGARNMICKFTLSDVSRIDENSHGVSIDTWEVVDNSPIKDYQSNQ